MEKISSVRVLGWVVRIGVGVVGITLSTFFWIVLIPLAFILLIPFRRFIVQTALNVWYGRGRFTLAKGIDALFAHDETPGSSSAPHMLLVHRGQAPSIATVRDRFLQHVFLYRDKEGGRPVYEEKLKSRFISRKWGWPMWERMDDTKFNIEKHVKLLQDDAEAGRGMTEDEVLERMGELMQEKEVHNSAPQWQFLLIQNYIPKGSNSHESHFASVIRLHHAYGDGSSFLLLVDKALADGPIAWKMDPMRPLPLSPITHWGLTMKSYLFGVVPFLRTVVSAMMDGSPFIIDANEGYSMKGKMVGWTEPLLFPFFKELVNNSGTAFSSTALTAFCGALRKLQQRKGINDSKFREKGGVHDYLNVGVVSAMIPYTTSQLQNSFCTYSVPCPLREHDVSFRLQKTHSTLKRVSSSTEPIFNYFVMRCAGHLPRVGMDVLLSSAGTGVLFSNIPGPTKPVSIFGSEVVEMGGWLPLIKSYGFGLTAISTFDRVRLCLTSDSSLISSTEELARFLNEMVDELELLGKIYRVAIPPFVRDTDNEGRKRRTSRDQYGLDKRTTA